MISFISHVRGTAKTSGANFKTTGAIPKISAHLDPLVFLMARITRKKEKLCERKTKS
jgi:hypothetical protein